MSEKSPLRETPNGQFGDTSEAASKVSWEKSASVPKGDGPSESKEKSGPAWPSHSKSGS